MSVSGVGSTSAMMVQAVVDMRARLADLQRQLGSGMKSVTYAGIGLDRGLTVGLRSQLSAIGSYRDTITMIGVRLDVAQTALGRMDALSNDVKRATQLAPFDLDDSGQTTGQQNARLQLHEMLGMLNTRAGERYLFSGRAGDQPAVETMEHILDGDGLRAGFKQVVAERRLADLGANGLGRLAIPAAVGNVVTVSEEPVGSPFGFKLAGVASTLTNAAVAGPAGAPPAISVDFTGGNPNAGETIKLSFTLPDGSSEAVTLTATTAMPAGPNEFTIAAATGDTAINLQAALATAVGQLAGTALSAASAVAAAEDFFDVDGANPPRRVDGPPFDTATALVAGTPADTVTWYTGEAGSDPARSTAVARADQAVTVAYGMRANEQGLRLSVQNIAVFAALTFSATDPAAADKYRAVANRVGSGLTETPGQQKINDLASDLAGAQVTLGAAKDRHIQTQSMLTDLLDHIQGVPVEEVGAQILALQTRLQASLQTTAMLFQTSLVNYI
jgi:flagellin-like hook-associated protein FlgL